MTTDRLGMTLKVGMFVAVLPHSTRKDASLEEVRDIGVDEYGTVLALDGDYVTVVPDEAHRGVRDVRRDLVLVANGDEGSTL